MQLTYVEHSGTDLSVVNAARVSFGKKSEWELKIPKEVGDKSTGMELTTLIDEEYCYLSSKDTKLINYLATHEHFSPFNHCFLTCHVKAPIFVARQLVKHEYMPWNEISRRYVDDEPEFYIPDKYRIKSPDKKQGSSSELIELKKINECPVCRTKYIRTNSRQLYCSSSCQSKGWRNNEGWVSNKLSRLKQSAEKRGLEFNLTDLPQPTHCVYLGLELDYTATSIQDNSPSVDRIDNSKGYTTGNIQIISNKANIMKGASTDKELVEFAKKVLAIHAGYITPQSDSVEEYYKVCKEWYKDQISQGVAPELARNSLPTSLYTEWYWSGTLGAWMKMYNLRAKEDTQEETRTIARMAGEVLQSLYPVSFEALRKV